MKNLILMLLHQKGPKMEQTCDFSGLIKNSNTRYSSVNTLNWLKYFGKNFVLRFLCQKEPKMTTK